MRASSGVAIFIALVLGFAAPASAEWDLWEGDNTSLRLGANLQMLSAYLVLPDLEIPGIPTTGGLGSAVGRLEWSAELGDSVTVDIHNRFLWQSSTVPDELLQQGFGVTLGTDRRLDTATELIDNDTTSLVHDLDRFVVGIYLDRFDLYLGRQAISWGVSDLFRVADRFAPLSPFELDTLQRRGVDAARVVTHLSQDLELDLVVADRGPDTPLSLAARLEYFGVSTDVYGAFGRFWERLSLMGGVSWLAGNWKVFGEGELLWNLDEVEPDRPRATVGIQRVAMRWQLGAEYHYNGLGTIADNGYAEVMQQPELERGETYFMGRHYLGATSFYAFDTGWALGGGAMMNLLDPSAVVFPSVRYELEEQMTISAGAYLGFGEEGSIGLEGLTIPSEYGTVADLYFLQMTAFF